MCRLFLLFGLGMAICIGCNSDAKEAAKSTTAMSNHNLTDTMRILTTPDIKDRIKSDFQDSAIEATKALEEALSRYEYLNNERIIRCIIYLSKGKLDKLKMSINQAIEDPRDVMLWAEYINLGDKETPKRVRDFNKSFQNAEKGVRD